MPQYQQAPLEVARRHEHRAAEWRTTSRQSRHNADAYVLLAVLFASVLFFGGFGGTFESRSLRRAVLAVAVVLFLVTFTALITTPVGSS
jgi:hypothetical protein